MADLAQAKLDEAVAMYGQGMPIEAIAKELEEPLSRVRKALAAHAPKRGSVASRANEAKVCEDYVSGIAVSAILAEHKITYPMLYTILAHGGVEIRAISLAPGRQAQLQAAVEMYAAGAPLWKIKAETGVAQPVLHSRLHELGVPLRRPRKVVTE